jgi:hypothetical protein
MAQHLAEKIHALTRPHGDRDNSRVKDLVDVVIIAEGSPLSAKQATEALEATFGARHTHSAPSQFPAFPRAWRPEYRRMAVEVGVRAQTLEEALGLAESLVTPLLVGSADGLWMPEERRWSDRRTVHMPDHDQ